MCVNDVGVPAIVADTLQRLSLTFTVTSKGWDYFSHLQVRELRLRRFYDSPEARAAKPHAKIPLNSRSESFWFVLFNSANIY